MAVRRPEPHAGGAARGGWALWLAPSMADILFAALLAFALAVRGHQLFNSDGDLARHLAVGREILAGGAVPSVDLFSWTRAGDSFVPYEWLSEVLFFLAYRHLGVAGVAVLAASLATLPFLLLTRWIIRDGANPFLALALVTIGALAGSMHWLARPHLFTILLALLWARALDLHRRTGDLRHLILLPLLMALWVNLHGGFLVGFVMLAAYAALPRSLASSPSRFLAFSLPRSLASPRASLIAVALASLAAVGLNPAGYGVLPHVAGYLGQRLLVDVTVEYRSPNFHDLGPQLFLALVLLAMASLATARRRPDPADVGMLVLWTAFSLYSVRNVPLFMVICLPLVARLAGDAAASLGLSGGLGRVVRLAATDRQLGRPLLPALCISLALLVSTGNVGDARPRLGFDRAVFPVEALARAEDVGARGRLFNYFAWGGYVLYAGYPRHRVFIDGQTDFYGEELTRDYLKVAQLEPDWEAVLDRYRVDWILFPHQSPLSLMLIRSPGWKLAYEDRTADIFVRSSIGDRR